jgi:uncharacterized protein (TIGR00255 family)
MDRPAISMTGAGFAAGATEVGELRIEVRTVNGRSLATKQKLTSACAGFEVAIEALVRERVRRGSVNVSVERQAAVPAGPDRAILRAAAQELRDIAAELSLPAPTLADVVQYVGHSGRGEATTSRPLPPRVRELIEQALEDLQRGRLADGRGTVAAIETHLAEFSAHLATAVERAPRIVDAYRERLLQRVQDFVQAHAPGPAPVVDILREVAVYADKVDVAEELQRLHSHLGEIRAVLRGGGEVGRRLELLLQELLRETNTLGAKSPDSSFAHAVVAMKSGIDRLREQAANLE